MLVKKGRLTRNEEGSLILVNASDQVFKINDAVATIWKRCDGKTREELSREIAEERNSDFNVVNGKMAIIVGQLIKAGLAEDIHQGRGLDEQSGNVLLEEIPMPTPPSPPQMASTRPEYDEIQGIEEKNLTEALRDIQNRLQRIEDKIGELNRFEIKAGDKLVFKEESGRIIVEKA
jgi:hypothetical protein